MHLVTPQLRSCNYYLHIQVRRWAMGVVQSLGQVDWDDYDSLEQVLSWIVTVITFDQFDDPMEETGGLTYNLCVYQ